MVRIWARKKRFMLNQLSVHSKEVRKVFPDLMKSNIIHSCSIDKSVNSYDLETERKVIIHHSNNGLILDMTQRKDHENELVTCGTNMPLFFWDCDVVEPVDAIQTDHKQTCLEISPNGKLIAVGTDYGNV